MYPCCKCNSSFSCYTLPLQNKCVPYWPTTEGESKEAGRYVVTLRTEKDAADYKVRVIELTAPHRVRKQSFQYLCANIHSSTHHFSAYSTCGPDSVLVFSFNALYTFALKKTVSRENSIVSLKCGVSVINKQLH